MLCHIGTLAQSAYYCYYYYRLKRKLSISVKFTRKLNKWIRMTFASVTLARTYYFWWMITAFTGSIIISRMTDFFNIISVFILFFFFFIASSPPFAKFIWNRIDWFVVPHLQLYLIYDFQIGHFNSISFRIELNNFNSIDIYGDAQEYLLRLPALVSLLMYDSWLL